MDEPDVRASGKLQNATRQQQRKVDQILLGLLWDGLQREKNTGRSEKTFCSYNQKHRVNRKKTELSSTLVGKLADKYQDKLNSVTVRSLPVK